MNAKAKLFLLLLLCLCLYGCASSPVAGDAPSQNAEENLISAQPSAQDARTLTATLYFRYAQTSLLRQEVRELTVLPNETREKALVSALLEGSRQSGSTLLFPENTQVLSTLTQDQIVYVTFNDALYSQKFSAQELENRIIAMAALTATLTESGDARAVQVLVRDENNVTGSMRLRSSYFGEQSDIALPPLTRTQSMLPTPAAYARALLQAWQQRDWTQACLYLPQRQRTEAERFYQAQALIDYTVSEGTVAPDGQSAVVCVDCTLLSAQGEETHLLGYPLHMTCEDGAWKISLSEALRLMGVSDE